MEREVDELEGARWTCGECARVVTCEREGIELQGRPGVLCQEEKVVRESVYDGFGRRGRY